jgi:hypothetical protein
VRLNSRRIGRVKKVKTDTGWLGGQVVLDAAEVMSGWGLKRDSGSSGYDALRGRWDVRRAV